MRHLENMAKVMLATGLIVAYGYMMEAFMAWYGANTYDDSMILQTGCSAPTAHTYWLADPLQLPDRPGALVPAGAAQRVAPVWLISIVVNIGMWLERYVIVVTSLHRDFLPSSWDMYHARSGTTRPITARSACSSRCSSCSSGSCR